MGVAMGAGISAVALLSADPAHGGRAMPANHESFRFGAGVIRGALLSVAGSGAGLHLHRRAAIRARADRRRIRVDSDHRGERGGRLQPLRALLWRVCSARLGPVHAIDVVRSADAGAGTRRPLSKHGPAADSGSLSGCGHRTLARRVRLRGDSFDSNHGAGRTQGRSLAPSRPRRLLVLTAVWLLIFFGRTTWGYFMLALGLPGTFHVSRFESVFELVAVLVTAWGLARMVAAAARFGFSGKVLTVIALAAMAFVIFAERARYLKLSNYWGDESLAGIAREGGDLDAALADIRTLLRERPGRVWTGPSGRWGAEFQIAKSQPYSFVSLAGMDELSFLYHSLSWSADVTAELDELDPYQAKLFAMRAALAPVTQPMPFYFKRRAVHGRLAVYEASSEGYFGLVDIGARYDGPLSTVLNRDWAWMQNPAVRAGAVVALGGDIRGVPQWKMFQPLPSLDPRFSTPRGEVISERKQGETYSARLAVLRPCYALLKITYFPGQRATVDGKPAPIFRVYPDFCAIPVGPGEHRIEVRYRPGPRS